MVVLNEKDVVPPPPYFAIEQGQESNRLSSASSRNPFTQHHSSSSTSTIHLPSTSGSNSHSQRPRAAPALPSHVSLLIVYSTLPRPGEVRLDRATGMRRRESGEEMAIRTTRTLYWMAFCLRAVNRGFYLASMHILRSTFLPHYMQRVRAPYSSDPFPHTSVSSSPQRSGSEASGDSALAISKHLTGSVVGSMQCESEVLDLFILHQLHEDVFADDTSLHTDRADRFRDLFDFMQPRARLTDLVRGYGAGAGLVALSEEDMSSVEDENEDDDGEQEYAGSSSTMMEKRAPGLRLNSKLARSASSLTLVNQYNTASPSSSQVKLSSFEFSIPEFQRSSSIASPTRTWMTRKKRKILSTALRISFSPRRVGVVYIPQSGSTGRGQGREQGQGSGNVQASGSRTPAGPRTIVDIARDRDEPLERSASRLVAGLKTWLGGW